MQNINFNQLSSVLSDDGQSYLNKFSVENKSNITFTDTITVTAWVNGVLYNTEMLSFQYGGLGILLPGKTYEGQVQSHSPATLTVDFSGQVEN